MTHAKPDHFPVRGKNLHRILVAASFLFLAPAAFTQPVINEFVASNGSTLADENGDQPDWIELYNPGTETISLGGWYLSDDEDDPIMWVFPNVLLEPGAFLVVFASGKDRTEGIYLHTNFAISSSGEPLLLSNPEGELVDFVDPVELPRDVSFGRQPDGGQEWYYFTEPTPGASNETEGHEGVMRNPVSSHETGFYSESFMLTNTLPMDGLIVRYTLDGSVPTEESPQLGEGILISSRQGEPNVFSNIRTTKNYQTTWVNNIIGWRPAPDDIKKATVIRMRSFRDGYIPSEPVTHTFWVGEEFNEQQNHAVISLVTDPSHFFDHDSGIYVPGDSVPNHL